MHSREIRKRFLDFFAERGHTVIPSASLVPQDDPSVLFTTAGMQPLVPYLLGNPHPKGKRLVNVQKCLRTGDIDEVGDRTHFTFFEMLGNWSLGDYFKKEAIEWSYELLTSQEEGFGLDPAKLYITCFEGDENAPRDTESAEIWKSRGVPEDRIYFRGEDNWWSPGENGPSGPSSEMFYDISGGTLGDLTSEEFEAADEKQDVVEVWNDVFMEYEKKGGKVIGKLSQKNVDTGAGLERLVAVLQGVESPYETDLFEPIMATIPRGEVRARRVVADHIRASVFLIGDGVLPSNTDRGYILRRLIRRAVRYADTLGMKNMGAVIDAIVEAYAPVYPNLHDEGEKIRKEIHEEEARFRKTLDKGLKELEKMFGIGTFGHIKEGKDIRDYPAINEVDAKKAFLVFQTYGFPLELIQEELSKGGLFVDEKKFQLEMKGHQELSRKGAEQKFKGGLADTSEKTTQLHTATHLMLAGLRKYLGEHVHQAGSNITTERTRFDFTHPEKVPREILDKVEAYVNEALAKKCDVVIEQMPKEEAQKAGVEGSFWEKYPDTVNVYTVRCDDGTVYSRELCGGPHVAQTGEIQGTFKITKEEAVAAGIRRVKAVLE